MAWLFIDKDCIEEKDYLITGSDARHIDKSLRMKIGEEITLCDRKGRQYHTEIRSVEDGGVMVEILEEAPCINEPNVKVTLYQALPKGDKMDLIIQKAVELGVYKIVPVITSRCISRPEGKALLKKRERYQKIAKSAAEQSRRGIIPEIAEIEDFKSVITRLEKREDNSKIILFYEMGGSILGEIVSKEDESIAVFIGSEGGFAPEEVEQIQSLGGVCATLGKRILRAETAPITAMSIIMYITGNLD